MITSSVEREGMISNHVISSEGQVHAQALITWEEIDKETLWKKKIKTEKEDLMEVQRRVVAYARRKKILSMYWEMVS